MAKSCVRARTFLKGCTLLSLAAGLSLSLAACDQNEKARQSIERVASEAQTSLESAKNPAYKVAYDPLVVKNKIFSGNAALRMHRGMPLPNRFEDERGITLVSADSMSMSDLANAITAQTGIPIRLTSLSIPGRAGPSPSPNGLSPIMPLGSSSDTSSGDMPVSYEGPLSGLLDRMCAYFGTTWRYDGSSVTISRYQTRIFTIEALPGSHELNEGMQDDTSSASGSSGSSSSSGMSTSSASGTTNTMTQNSKTTMDLKYWDELTNVVTSIVGGQGSAIVSPTIGTVTVTTTPEIMTTVADFLAKENKRLSRQIAINVQIFSVSLSQSEDFNVSFDMFLRHLSGSLRGIAYDGTGALPAVVNPNLTRESFGTLSVAIVDGSSSNPRATAGSILSALSAIGNASQVAQFPMTTLNNHPVARRVGTDTAYIQSVTQSTTTSTASNTTLTPIVATIHDGFSLQLTPRLLDDGRILLQYSMSLIGLETLNKTPFPFTSDTSFDLSLPITDNRLFVQQSMLRSGQTLVIGGIDQQKFSQDKRGVGSPDNFLLGGGTSSLDSHVMLMMAITPQVMDVAADEEQN